MLSFLGLDRRLWLPILLIAVTQDCNAAIAMLNVRQSGKGGGDDGDSDSDSDSDGESESCRNGVCTVCRKGVCTTSTRGSNPASQTSPVTATTTGTGPAHISSGTHSAPASSGTSGNNGLTNGKSAKKGLSTGGIVGLVLGLLVISGLLIMLFLKRRAHLRHLQQKPRGTMLLSHDTPSDAPSLDSGSSGAGSQMVESGLGSGVLVGSAAAIAAASLAAVPRSGYPAPQPYKSFDTEADGAGVPSTSGAAPVVAQSKASHLGRQDGPLIEIDTHTPSTSQVSPTSLPSPHERYMFSPVDTAAIVALGTSSETTRRQSQELPNVPPSTTHAEMVAFQKELERDHEKDDQLAGGRIAEVHDPPPTYSDR